MNARPWRYPPVRPTRPFKGPPPVSFFADRPTTYRDAAPPPVEVSSPPPKKPENLYLACAVLQAFTAGFALAREDLTGVLAFGLASATWFIVWVRS